jgi:anaerobic magnesium-protoporphyrin IX monomethyl ester cyclase
VKILFIEVDTEAAWSVASLGPGAVAPYVRQHGHEATFFRARIHHTLQDVLAEIHGHQPDILGFSLVTKQWQRARKMVAEIRREVDIPVIAGGLHPTFSPEEVLSNPGFDYVCLGEGEASTQALLDALEAGKPTEGIDGIWTRGGQRPSMRAPFEPIDDLPFMDRSVLDEPEGVVHMNTQRGCPFVCTYCAARMWNELYEKEGRFYGRRRSHQNVLQELETIRANGPLRWVNFLDDIFTLDREWVARFTPLYKKHIGVGFSVLSRVDTIDERMIHMLADAGCKMITYGVESGSERVRKRILHRPMTNERIIKVMDWTHAAGIMAINNFMIGLPGETRDDLDQTVALASRIKQFDFAYYVFYPYPGTKLFQVCKEQGLLPPDYLELPANHRGSILRLKDLTNADIQEYYDKMTALRMRICLERDPTKSMDEQPELVAHVSRVAATF